MGPLCAGEPPNEFAFLGLKLSHGDRVHAVAVWRNGATVKSTLRSGGAVIDLQPPQVSGWYGNSLAFGVPKDGSPMRYQSVDNAFFTVNVSMDVDSGVQVCDSFPVTGAVEGRCMGTHAQFMHCACAFSLVLLKRTARRSSLFSHSCCVCVYVCMHPAYVCPHLCASVRRCCEPVDDNQLLLARVEVLTSVSEEWSDDASSACREAVGVEVFPWISLPIPPPVTGAAAATARSPARQYALPIDTLHGSVYRVSLRAIDRAGNVNTSALNCFRVDKTRVSVTVQRPEVVPTAVSDTWNVTLMETGPDSDKLLYAGPLHSDSPSSDVPGITVRYLATEDVTPLLAVSHCWSSNPFGTCDVVSRSTVRFNATGPKVLTYSSSTTLELNDTAVRALLDGVSVCAWVVRGAVDKRCAVCCS